MINNITMVGRLLRDPELRTIQATGNSVASFAIACDDSRKGANGEKQTVFINCSVFGKQAEIVAKYCQKGRMVGIVGRLIQRKYMNKSNVEVTSTEIVCDRIELMSDGTKEQAQPQPKPVARNVSSFPEEEDLPF